MARCDYSLVRTSSVTLLSLLLTELSTSGLTPTLSTSGHGPTYPQHTFPSILASSWSSSERSSSPELDAELIRDAPLYPPLQGLESLETNPDYYDTSAPNKLYDLPRVEDLNESNIEGSDIIVTPEDNGDETVETDNETKVQNIVDVDDETGEGRKKRSSDQDWNKTKSGSPRVRTGDTILNIRGVVRDSIADAPLPVSGSKSVRPARPAPASRLDTVVIRPAAASLRPPLEQVHRDAKTTQTPRDGKELLVEPHSRARITCDLTNVTNLKWYKDEEAVNLPWGSHSGDPVWREAATDMKIAGYGEVVVVARATRGDSAKWRCTGTDSTGKTVVGSPTELLIYESVRAVYLSVDGRRLDAGNTWVPARDSAALPVRCHAEGAENSGSTKPDQQHRMHVGWFVYLTDAESQRWLAAMTRSASPDLSWRLVALDPSLDPRPYLKTQQTNYSIEGVSSSLVVVRAARELHNATLTCTASQHTPRSGRDEQAAKLEIHVTYPPSFVISRWPGFGISLLVGGAAALRCDVDANPPAKAWWQRDSTQPTSPPEPESVTAGSATLRFPALTPAHAGWYRCRATWMHQHYSSIGYYLNVHPAEEGMDQPATPATEEESQPDHQKVEVPVGGDVQLHCPKGSVGCWWRRADNGSSGWTPAGSHHAHGVLGIKEALYQEGGEYRCVGARAPDLARLRELKRVTLKVTGAATAVALSATPAAGGWRLECGACGRGVRVTWLRGAGGRGERAELQPDLAQHCWRAVLHISEPDEVWCVAASAGGGAVAVFPPRTPPPSSRTPAPARHVVRPPNDHAVAIRSSLLVSLAFAGVLVWR